MAPVPAPLPRSRKKKKRSALSQYWWVVPLAAAAALTAGWWLWPRKARTAGAGLPDGFIDSVATVEQEYARFYGKLLKDPDVTRRVQLAARRAEAHDYVGAVDQLEGASRRAAVPIVFNNLGVLYALLNDRSRAVNAFRDALSRDIDYQPVRANIDRLKGLTANAADPVTREIEPNSTNLLANVIRLGAPVDAEIAAGINDVDCFRVTAPPAPRDLLAIRIANRSATLTPALKFFDADMRILGDARPVRQAGDSLTHYMSPLPNSTIYLNIYGVGAAGGAYSLAVQALKAYDSYEPNDDIFNARRIDTGRPIEANIMDAEDTDFFSFISPRTGTVSIEIANRSAGLIPALTTFTPDMRNSGFGPDIRTLGASLHHKMLVEEGLTYFLQVWSQANTSGEYTLSID